MVALIVVGLHHMQIRTPQRSFGPPARPPPSNDQVIRSSYCLLVGPDTIICPMDSSETLAALAAAPAVPRAAPQIGDRLHA